jgi:hypothetical protein
MNSIELGKIIKNYYINNPSGGNCHIVLDDHNIHDNFIKECIILCEKNNDKEGLEIMNNMLNMKKTARSKSIINARKGDL